MKKLLLVFILLLSACVSYHDGYEYSYRGYSGEPYYGTPISVRGLSYYDFSMLDNNPDYYFEQNLWQSVGDINKFLIRNLVNGMF